MINRVLDRVSSFVCKLKIPKNALAVLFVLGFLISLLPIVVTAFYSVPVYDDYTFGYYSHQSYAEGGSFIAGVMESCESFYMTWQGFFTSNFWASVQPFNMDVDLYFVSGLLIIISLVVSLFYFANTILRNVLKMSFCDYILITVPIVTCVIYFMPSIAEGFYWMDGALSTFIMSLFFLMTAFVINYIIADTRKKSIIYSILSILSLLCIFGSMLLNYITGMLLFVAFLIYVTVNKKKKKLLIIVLMAIYTIGLIIILLSPGNAVRMEESGAQSSSGYSFLASVIYALFYSFTYFGEWTTLCIIAVLLFVSIFFFETAKKSKFEFKKPLLVFLFMYILYAARMSVQLFSLGYLGSGRQINAYYIGYIFMISISFLYFVGWLSKKSVVSNKNFESVCDCKKVSLVFVVFTMLLFAAGAFDYGVKNINSVSTAISLVNGETQQYSKEMHQRIEIFEDESVKDVVVKPVSVKPDCFMDEPLTEDPDYWTNSSVARYYNKDTVILEK